ncbi:AAA family ATPase [Aldersonia kunmingensis]|uniref:AAA family ATPase n=1 Tax=Aldersonia kunmingensis TaxID=408066 RepID=UPI00082C3C86|nr:AAA family ATPase [Aldersonia kunmingensis]
MTSLPLIRVELRQRASFDPDAWYLDLPAIAELRTVGLDFEAPITVIVGENGSGKSTLLEAIAGHWESSLTGLEYHPWSAGTSPEDTDLREHLQCIGADPRPQGGCFLRAEAMHTAFSRADTARPRDTDQALNQLSHGQSFLRYVGDRPIEQGLWVLDEPEAALSFHACLALIAVLGELAAEGSQVIMATHSPVLAACPGADIWELTETGIDARQWDELDMVRNWRAFLDEPQRYLRHL